MDRIDLYQLHAPDPAVPFEDSVGALAALREAGKIRWAGLSNVTVAQIEKARQIVPITSVQNRLNPFFPESRRDGVIAACTEHGLGLLAYSPTGGGRLNRKLPAHPVVAAVARRRNASPHAVVIAWVLARDRPSSRSRAHVPPTTRPTRHRRRTLELSAEDLGEISSATFSRE